MGSANPEIFSINPFWTDLSIIGCHIDYHPLSQNSHANFANFLLAFFTVIGLKREGCLVFSSLEIRNVSPTLQSYSSNASDVTNHIMEDLCGFRAFL